MALSLKVMSTFWKRGKKEGGKQIQSTKFVRILWATTTTDQCPSPLLSSPLLASHDNVVTASAFHLLFSHTNESRLSSLCEPVPKAILIWVAFAFPRFFFFCIFYSSIHMSRLWDSLTRGIGVLSLLFFWRRKRVGGPVHPAVHEPVTVPPPTNKNLVFTCYDREQIRPLRREY